METGFKNLRDLVNKAIRYGVFARDFTTEKGIHCQTYANDGEIFYRASDGEFIRIHPDMTYETRYGSISPLYLATFIPAAIKAINHARYIEGQQRLRDDAIEWQYYAREDLSYGELAAIQNRFYKRAKKYGLIRELRENAII